MPGRPRATHLAGKSLLTAVTLIHREGKVGPGFSLHTNPANQLRISRKRTNFIEFYEISRDPGTSFWEKRVPCIWGRGSNRSHLYLKNQFGVPLQMGVL